MRIINDGSTVSIGFDNTDEMIDCFLDIYVDGGIPSPFKKITDAELFAEIIVKLLDTILGEDYENGRE